MNLTALPASFCRTASTTSTTGPQARLVQNFGVAKTTTNGEWARTAWRTDVRSSSTSGGTRVVTSEASPPADASVGVRDATAFEPTAGARLFARASTFTTPW